MTVGRLPRQGTRSQNKPVSGVSDVAISGSSEFKSFGVVKAILPGSQKLSPKAS